MNRGVQRSCDFEGGDHGRESLGAHRVEELRECHRPHVQIRDPTHGHGEPMVGENEVQQRARGQHGQITHVLSQVPQRGNGFGHRLNLVDEQQAVGTDGTDVRQSLQDVQEICWIVSGKGGSQISVAFQVDLGQRAPGAFGKQPHQCRLSDLSSSAKNQRLPVRHCQPVLEKRELPAVHVRIGSRRWIARNVTKQGYVSYFPSRKQGGVLSCWRRKWREVDTLPNDSRRSRRAVDYRGPDRGGVS